jgi:hypothetical protein
MLERRLTPIPVPLLDRLINAVGTDVDCEVVAPALLAS